MHTYTDIMCKGYTLFLDQSLFTKCNQNELDEVPQTISADPHT